MLLHDIIVRKTIFSATKWENLHVNTVIITWVFDTEYVIISYLSLVHHKVFNPSQSRWMICIYPKIMRPRDVIHETRHPCTRLQCRDWWDNYKVTWYLRGQTRRKICQYKESRSNLFNLDNRKWRTQNAVVTVDFFTARNYDLKLVETRTVHGVHWEIDMPTSWAHFFYEHYVLAVDFLCLLPQKRARERECWGQLPKQRTLRKSNWKRINKLDWNYFYC